MKNLWEQTKKRWFLAVDPKRLAIIRIATGGFCLWYLLSRFNMLQGMVRNRDAFEPIGILSWMEQPLDGVLFWWFSIVLIALNVCYILGWKFRFTGPAFAVLVLLFFTYRNSWSMIYHNRNALVLHIFILGFMAASDACSIDSWNNAKKGKPPANAHWRYGWPIMLICAVTIGSYFLSGIAKVAGDLAFEWADGSAMRSQIAVDAIRKSILGAGTSPLFDAIYKHTWLFLVMGIFTFVVELGAPLAMYKKKWGRLWALLTLSMHWGIFMVMGIRFRYQMTGLIFLSFFEPEKWFTNDQRKLVGTDNQNAGEERDKATKPIILFDGICNLCNHWVYFIMRNEKRPEFLFASLQSDVGKKMLASFGIKNSMDSIVLIENGALYHKSEAVLRILRKLRHLWPLLTVLLIVPRTIRDGIYKLVARNRYVWFGKKQSCALMERADKVRFIEP